MSTEIYIKLGNKRFFYQIILTGVDLPLNEYFSGNKSLMLNLTKESYQFGITYLVSEETIGMYPI